MPPSLSMSRSIRAPANKQFLVSLFPPLIATNATFALNTEVAAVI